VLEEFNNLKETQPNHPQAKHSPKLPGLMRILSKHSATFMAIGGAK
jgi:hypothetical protein